MNDGKTVFAQLIFRESLRDIETCQRTVYSDDLSNWVRDDDHAGIDISEEGWDSEMQCYPHVFRCDDKIYLLYKGNQFGRFGFGLAVLEESGSRPVSRYSV